MPAGHAGRLFLLADRSPSDSPLASSFPPLFTPKAFLLAKNQNTFEKLRREQEKKRKAKEKRERKIEKKDDEGTGEPAPIVDRFDLAGDY